MLRLLVARPKVEKVEESRRPGKSDTRTRSKYCLKGEDLSYSAALSEYIISLQGVGGCSILLYRARSLSLTDQENDIIASFIFQLYGLIIWLSASIQWATAAFASIICSYPDSVVSQPRRRVSLGIDQRDPSSGGARPTLICEINYKYGSTSCSRESSKTTPPAQRCH